MKSFEADANALLTDKSQALLSAVRAVYQHLQAEQTSYQQQLDHKQHLTATLEQMKTKTRLANDDLTKKKAELSNLKQEIQTETDKLTANQQNRQQIIVDANFKTVLNDTISIILRWTGLEHCVNSRRGQTTLQSLTNKLPNISQQVTHTRKQLEH